MSDADVILQVEGASKRFCRDLKRSLWYGLTDIAGDCLGRSTARADLRPGEFWALHDVSFELRRGECLGLIGSNGAGKTTLLRLISGLIKPDAGAIRRRGRLGALIALGAGFNPVLTGRENIFVNAAILGLTKKETLARLDEIIAFADIGDALEAPVQSYSSGMTVRLGFAIAAHLEPDLLLIDEVLAVGDMAFRAKCYGMLGALKQRAAVVVVSHNHEHLLQIADKGHFLENGMTRFVGKIDAVADLYLRGVADMAGEAGFERWDAPLMAAKLEVRPVLGALAEVSVELECSAPLADCSLNFFIASSAGEVLVKVYGHLYGEILNLRAGRQTVRCLLEGLTLGGGEYPLTVDIVDASRIRRVFTSHRRAFIRVEGPRCASEVQCRPRLRSDS
jgi:lipopolysaccharide transport system ATP-binding protein